MAIGPGAGVDDQRPLKGRRVSVRVACNGCRAKKAAVSPPYRQIYFSVLDINLLLTGSVTAEGRSAPAASSSASSVNTYPRMKKKP